MADTLPFLVQGALGVSIFKTQWCVQTKKRKEEKLKLSRHY
jgi:hypothetical protein